MLYFPLLDALNNIDAYHYIDNRLISLQHFSDVCFGGDLDPQFQESKFQRERVFTARSIN